MVVAYTRGAKNTALIVITLVVVLLILPSLFLKQSGAYFAYDSGPQTPDEIVDGLFPPILGTPGFWFLSDKNLSFQNNVYIDHYKLHYCKIDKNAGSALQATMCFLSDPKVYGTFYETSKWSPGLYGYASSKLCANETTKGTLRKETVTHASRSDFFKLPIKHFAVLRHPVERFVSAYLDICVHRKVKVRGPSFCYGCDTIACFLTENYWYISKKVDAQLVTKWSMDWHFYPQSWYCDFENNFDKYQLLDYKRGGDFVARLADILLKQNVPEANVKIVASVLNSKTTSHASDVTESRTLVETINEDKVLLKILQNTYYNDFKLFGYKLL